MERVVNPGPIDRTLLLSQHEHKSELFWKGEIPLVALLGRQYDRALVTAMVERWRPETHCFHLPFGEVTITLQDMQVLFGLCIDGDVVYNQDATRRIRPWRTLLETLTRCTIAPTDMDGASRVRIHSITGYLRDQLHVDPIRDATPVERVERIARLYMLVILGGILFPNSSGNLISLHYLAFLDRIHDVGKHSWGSAVLAYLYRALSRASIDNVIDICRFIPLFQVWYWERVLPVQPSAPPQHDGDILLLYARRWTRGTDSDTESYHVHIPIRDQLDRMTENQSNATVWSFPACTCDCWGTNHHVHNQRRRLGPKVLEMMDKYFRDWGNRHQSLAVEVNDGTSGAGYKLWYMMQGRLFIGSPALEVAVSSDFVHSADTSIAMSRGLFKLYSLALQWQRDTTSASHGEEVSQIVKDTLVEAEI
ncbi:serine/threonine-protein phosphatase 7 long form homolog [Solanum pennellii]|uniref:Serine/threonine-protein phosphatase 7 long form homolog n=1 Tax=Solanum pennellii TaxID=28526 RepID=A0ABM1GZW8_SOLPN|nr:serine/threonine-protein phosphatase 7 long form homolog [Solanum pennellii]